MPDDNHPKPALSDNNQPQSSTDDDCRLYAPSPESWEACIKVGWEKEYCFLQRPGEDFFHLLMHGEIYLKWGDAKYCLNCALRRGFLTTDRLNWQHGPHEHRDGTPL